MSAYPSHVQDVLDAALECEALRRVMRPSRDVRRLADAIDAHRKATAPPEEGVMVVGFVDGRPNWGEVKDHPSFVADQVWRCVVTRVERMR